MDVPIPYLINDTRKAEFLKKTTFSHYLKKDVLDTLYKKIDEGKTSEMCLWLSECIASGYLEELWERAVLYYVKYINVNSPLVPYHFYRKLVHILKLKQQEHFQKHLLDLRNSQEIRNHFTELYCILTHSSKTRKSWNLPKITKIDFQSDFFKKQLQSPYDQPSPNFVHKRDPEELGIVINEFRYYLEEYQYQFKKLSYWILWFHEWEKMMILKIGSYTCAPREEEVNIDKKHGQEFIWLFWITIIQEAQKRHQKDRTQQIKSLFEFYKLQFTPSKKKKRLYILLNAIKLLDPQVILDAEKYPLFEKYYLTVQACANINILFKELKKEENQENDYIKSKIKMEASLVIAKHEDVTQFDEISKLRQAQKSQAKQQKEYREYQNRKKLEKRKLHENKEALKKNWLDTIDNHIIENSNHRPISVNNSNFRQKIEEHKQSGLGKHQKTINLIQEIDKKLKIKDEHTAVQTKTGSRKGKHSKINVFKT